MTRSNGLLGALERVYEMESGHPESPRRSRPHSDHSVVLGNRHSRLRPSTHRTASVALALRSLLVDDVRSRDCCSGISIRESEKMKEPSMVRHMVRCPSCRADLEIELRRYKENRVMVILRMFSTATMGWPMEEDD